MYWSPSLTLATARAIGRGTTRSLRVSGVGVATIVAALTVLALVVSVALLMLAALVVAGVVTLARHAVRRWRTRSREDTAP